MAEPKAELHDLEFTENPAVRHRRDQYQDVEIDVAKALKSWRTSLYSYEWMQKDGRIKEPHELTENEKAKRDQVEEKLRTGEKLEKPVLGIGLLENIEIGSGRATFLTLAAKGYRIIPVHIPKSNAEEFTSFLA